MKKNNVSPLLAGAGLGLIVVSAVMMLIHPDGTSYYLMSNSLGIIIATGLTDDRRSSEGCKRKSKRMSL